MLNLNTKITFLTALQIQYDLKFKLGFFSSITNPTAFSELVNVLKFQSVTQYSSGSVEFDSVTPSFLLALQSQHNCVNVWSLVSGYNVHIPKTE